MEYNNEHNNRIWELMARKLSGEATPEELAGLQELLGDMPEENYSLEIMQDLWNNKPRVDRQYAETEYRSMIQRMQNMGIDEGKFNEDEPGHSIIELEQPPRKKRRLIFFSILGAIIIGGALFFYDSAVPASKPDAPIAKNEISTRYGSKTNLVLPDGSKVWLNAGSKITYDKNYGSSIRELTLVGEAYFDVVKNTSKPFIIHTSKMDIKVLGTAFDVKCYPDEKTTETSLIRGSVEITLKDRSQKIILKPNEKITINNDDVNMQLGKNDPVKKAGTSSNAVHAPIITLGYLTREPVNNEIIETSWINNRLIFSDERFDDIAIKMERWFGVNIQFGSEKLKKLRFTGAFENETIDQALSAMQLTTAFKFNINKDHIIITH
jgi:ferric-dicitrate binding protein FerR (iron transport regulator)